MAYATLTDIEKSLPQDIIIQLTDDNNMGVVDQAVVDEAIAWADDVIDNHVRGKYPVPLNPVPDMIKKISVDLSIYFLYNRRFETDIPEGILIRYKNTMALLDKIQKGQILLNVDTTNKDTSEIRVNKSSEDRDFGAEVWERY